MTKDINIVYGPPQTGKTSLAKHLKEKYNFELLDFKELIEKVKKTKIDPENPDAEPEINFQDLIQGLKNYLSNIPHKKKIIIDNIFIPGGADGFLIDSVEKSVEILNIIGNLRNLYEIEVPQKDLLNMYKAKEGITEEITEEQKAAFEETLEKPNKLLEEIKNHVANVIKVKREENEEKAKKVFDSQYNVNFILLKHEYDICLEKSLTLFCARNKVLYINVPQLIYNHFYENDSEAKLLEAGYGKKKLRENCKDSENFDEFVYYKYNPINFERGLITKLIRDYIGKNSKLIEENGNFVLLSGYLNYDLLLNQDEPFNLPLLEIKSILELGELTSFIQITRNDIKLEEDEKPEQVVIEKKVVKKAEGEEEQPQEEQPQEEEGANKFKPENYAWTNYDGIPRNYIQIIKRYKTFPVKIIEASDTCREELIKALGNHLDNFINREELKYKGNITIIKINGEVPVETVEGVNKISKFVEGRREVDNVGKGKISKDKGRVGIIYEVL
jgi:adenylate kinase family enzyme